ncbi:Transcriptional activator protein EsaR [Pelagimonas phthalicica]|uniref:Transcriptional activator protein EsaR n=1 Tax=Pelagimonas phthalicica TaxID=1037362 RepID=A0A238J5I4_9RHOB|nr:autoinducer binding domain-containing protein [Pelagimonas phthalicica]TDS95466.1 DNA-binding CsgD family transcriptional regulator [Pelagimonas phthalicica]SMX26011.1 Transcriptional activator protein EsaR [Pelagimonas phthalicica]
MPFDYESVLNDLLLSNSVADAIAVLQGCCEIDFVTFHLMNSVSAQMDNPFVRTTYPPEWVTFYLLNNLVASDPVLKAATVAKKAFLWSDLDLAGPELDFLSKSKDFKIGQSGYSIPYEDEIGRRSVLSLNSHLDDEAFRDFIAVKGGQLQLLAHDLHMKGVSEAFAEAGDVPHLSPREYECLKWTSLGKSYSEIAIILSLSEHTVRSYLKMARVKLDSVTLAQAVTKATQMGLI